MSAISELLREAPVYKKAILAVAFTAGVGAGAYLAYRCATKASNPATGPSKREKKPTHEPKVEEPTVKKEEQFVAKTEPVKVNLAKTGSSPLKTEEPVRSGSLLKTEEPVRSVSPLRAEELSTSVTFEKISMAPIESDNFEHLTMSQINPLESSPVRYAGEEKKQEQTGSLGSSYVLPEVKSSAPLLNPPDIFESLTLSQEEQSISIISTTEDEPEETETHEHTSESGGHIEEASESRDDESQLPIAAHGVKLKDENDIIVVEPSSEESGSEKSEEETGPRSGMASAPTDFDTSRVSPVFGHQTYRRVDLEPEELVSFDPAKSHPASVGFKFGSDI